LESPLQITFKDMDSSDFLESLVRERAARLERFHPNIISCRVVLEVPHRSAESGKTAVGVLVEVKVPGRNTIVAKDAEERRELKNDHTAAINRAFQAIERQLDHASQLQNRNVKAHEAEGEAGVIVRLFPEQNYGFVEVKGSPDLYFTRNSVIGGSFDDLEPGTVVHVTRATTEGPMGPQASSVRLLGSSKSPA
jgi:ribosomal subunit interface protein